MIVRSASCLRIEERELEAGGRVHVKNIASTPVFADHELPRVSKSSALALVPAAEVRMWKPGVDSPDPDLASYLRIEERSAGGSVP